MSLTTRQHLPGNSMEWRRIIARTDSVDGRSVLLKWDPPADNGGSAITGYAIYKGRSRNDMKPVLVVAGHEYTDKETGYGKTFYYMVCARNARGEGVPTDILSTGTAVPERASLNATELVIEAVVLTTICVIAAMAYWRMQRRGNNRTTPRR